MQHTFLQKLVLAVLAGALVAAAYVYVYQGIIVNADESLNGKYRKPGAVTTPAPTPRRY